MILRGQIETLDTLAEDYREVISEQTENLLEASENYVRVQRLIDQLQEESILHRQPISDQDEELSQLEKYLNS